MQPTSRPILDEVRGKPAGLQGQVLRGLRYHLQAPEIGQLDPLSIYFIDPFGSCDPLVGALRFFGPSDCSIQAVYLADPP